MRNLEVGKEKKSEQNYSKLQWVLFVIIIPFIFALTLGLVILTVSGVNIFDAAKKYGSKIPVVSSYLGTSGQPIEQQLQKDIVEQQAIIQEKQIIIADLEKEIENKQLEIDALKKEIERLNAELEGRNSAENSGPQQYTIKDLVNVYKSMSAKNAAAILAEMPENEAVQILSALDSEKAAAILGKMDAANAAKFTSLLTGRAGVSSN